MDRTKDQDQNRSERVAEFFALFDHAPENAKRAHVEAKSGPAPEAQPAPAAVTPPRPAARSVTAPQLTRGTPARPAAVDPSDPYINRAPTRIGPPIESAPSNSISGVLQRIFGEKRQEQRNPVTVRSQIGIADIKGQPPLTLEHRLLGIGHKLTTCIVVALVTFAIAKSAPLERLGAHLGGYHPAAYARADDHALPLTAVFQPKFGPHAVQQCFESCSNVHKLPYDVCERNCRQLSLSEYPKPLPPRTVDAKLDADEIIASCRNRPIQFAGQWPRDRWKEETDRVRSVIDRRTKGGDSPDFGEGRLNYHMLLDLQRMVGLPVSSTPTEVTYTERLVRAGCLRAHLILTELALVIVHQNQDAASESYYRSVQRLLKVEAQRAEQLARGEMPGRATAARPSAKKAAPPAAPASPAPSR